MAQKGGLGLGKGIGALIPKELIKSDQSTQQTIVDEGTGPTSGVNMIEIDRIRPNPFQPRKDFEQGPLEELAASIRMHGVVTPITVRKLFDGYELVSGERRLRASKMAGLTEIPAYVISIHGDAQMLELAIIENVQREDLNPLEVALGYQRLIDECQLKQEEVAVKVGKDRSTVANMLRLLRLPVEAQTALRRKAISMGHARALLALSNEPAQMTVLREITSRDLSVRKTEALVKDIELGRKEVTKSGDIKARTTTTASTSTPNVAVGDLAITLAELENTLRHLFGTQVRLRMKSNESGAIEIEFYSFDDLERILDQLSAVEQSGKGR
jgi:ParB family transcriptional regulator, chromosome partitioning protein